MAGVIGKLIDILGGAPYEPSGNPDYRFFAGSGGIKDAARRAKEDTARQNLEAFLARAPADEPDLVAGTISLVEMKDLQPTGRGKWTGVAEKVRTIAQDEIEGELGPGALQQGVGGGQYVFCFANDDVAQAQMRTARMSERIRTRLEDEVPESHGHFAVEPFVAKVERQSILASDLSPIEALMASLRQIQAQKSERLQVSHASLVRSARLAFQPAWSRQRSALVLNRCFIDGASQFLLPAGLGASGPSSETLGRLDAILLTKTIERLHASPQVFGREAAVLLPVRFSTLQSPDGRQDFLMLHDQVPPDYASRLYFNIVLEDGQEPPLNLRTVLTELHPVLPRLVLHLPDMEWRLIEGMQQALVGVSCTVRSATLAAQTAELRLRRVAETSRAAGLLSVAVGADSLGAAQMAREAGFDFIAGTAIHATHDEPFAAESFIAFGAT